MQVSPPAARPRKIAGLLAAVCLSLLSVQTAAPAVEDAKTSREGAPLWRRRLGLMWCSSSPERP